MLLVDDFSRFMWVYMLKSKDEALANFKKFKIFVETESDKKLRAIRTDRGGEFTSTAFKLFCEEQGVKRFLTAPYSPQQNGVVERRNQTVVEMARCMLKSMEVPSKFWAEAVKTAVYILNRAPTQSVSEATPYQAWFGKIPNIHHLRVFGCVAHVKDVTPNLTKLANRSNQAIMIGYEIGSKAYRLFDPIRNKIIVSRDVAFEEGRKWQWNDDSGERIKEAGEFTVNFKQAVNPHPETPEIGTPISSSSTQSQSSSTSSSSSEPQKFRSLQEIYDNTREIEEASLCFLSLEEPTSFEEASKNENWKKAMEEEIASIKKNSTWELTDLPTGHKPIGLKWVYRLKKNPEGKIVKHKARLVAKGYVQRQGIDFNEVFAPVARLETIRVLLAVAAQKDWEVHHMDVKTAFLNGELEEDVYVAQPIGYEDKKNPNKVLKLHKALYGLRQAPRAWNSKLDGCLKELGFEQCPHEHALYKTFFEGEIMIVGVYVDDLVMTGGNRQVIKKFKTEMQQKFDMSDLGLLSFYLGIEVNQTPTSISLHQTSYARKILEKMGVGECNPCKLPMEPRIKLSKVVEGETTVDETLYRSVIGSLRYLVNTRPDITFSVGVLSRFMEKPTTSHMAAVKQVLRYIKGTINLGCVYLKKQSDMGLIGYCDSDLAGDIDDRKSTTGVLYFLGNNPVTWTSQKQRVVALSSCEAEYIAATAGTCQGIWLSRVIGTILGREVKATLKVDNKSAIALAKNPVFHDRSKHIDTRYHFIRDCVQAGSIDLLYVNTEIQLADVLTKSLGRQRFEELREKLSLKAVSQKE